MRIFFIVLLVVHGLIHVMGFVKAFYPASVTALTKEITKPAGLTWLLTALLFLIAAWLYFRHKPLWWLFVLAALVLSQMLLIQSWKDARWGTLVNIILLFVAVAGWGAWRFERVYLKDVEKAKTLQRETSATELLGEDDLSQLPSPVQQYLRYTGCVGKPKVQRFRIAFSGRIRADEQSPWMPFTSEQYNFMEQPTRLFFMKAVMKHLPVAGYHHYKQGKAVMDIRLLSLFRVQYQEGKQMDEAETVTFFNDMCCLAPATLIDKRISWLETKGNNVKARFTQAGIAIEAVLCFNDEGQLVNFISDNRYATLKDGSLQQFRWSTPLKNYRMINGYRLAGDADAIYDYPSGPFVYGQFHTTAITCNPE